ncbi:MAG: hypothetical protein U0636_09045 [Phycisphaerales bacterium]
MNHPPQRDHRKRAHQQPAADARFSASHVMKLLLLNCVLFLACGAFAGLIVGDWIQDKLQMRVIAAFVLIPLGMAVISTFIHAKSGRWSNVDSMSERMFK